MRTGDEKGARVALERVLGSRQERTVSPRTCSTCSTRSTRSKSSRPATSSSSSTRPRRPSSRPTRCRSPRRRTRRSPRATASRRRDRSSSRSFRNTTTSRCARSACRGSSGALGACFGRVVSMDSPRARAAGRIQLAGDALARAGARLHAAAVEVPRAALADRRHLGLRGTSEAAGVGPRADARVRAISWRAARRSA